TTTRLSQKQKQPPDTNHHSANAGVAPGNNSYSKRMEVRMQVESTQNEKPASITDCLKELRKAARRSGMDMNAEMGNGRYNPYLYVELWPIREEQKDGK